MNKKSNALRSVPANTHTDASRTGGKPDTVAKTAAASETLGDKAQTDTANQPAVSALVTGQAPSVKNIFAVHSDRVRRNVEAKLALVSQGRQRLAEAKDHADTARNWDAQSDEAADKGSILLYQARTTLDATGKPLISSEELTGALGDVFGYKAKKDGSPSKTPDGKGEAIRKRIVRAAAAVDFIRTGEAGTFFEGLTPEEVEPIVSRIGADKDGLTLNSAYNAFGELKSNKLTRVDPAFNPTTIGKLAERLAAKGSAEIIARSPALQAAYAGLIDVLNIVGSSAAALVAEEAAKAAKPLQQGAVA